MQLMEHRDDERAVFRSKAYVAVARRCDGKPFLIHRCPEWGIMDRLFDSYWNTLNFERKRKVLRKVMATPCYKPPRRQQTGRYGIG